MMRMAWAMLMLAVLAACQIGGPRDDAPRRASAPAAIQVTTLAPPTPAAPPQPAGVAVSPGSGAAPIPQQDQDLPPPPGSAPPAPAVSAPDAPDAAPAAAPRPAAQIACEKARGIWSPVAGSSARACVYRTRDAGQTCRTARDCEGQCLARSRSCAPVRPLFGCNDILQADGRQVTLCLD